MHNVAIRSILFRFGLGRIAFPVTLGATIRGSSIFKCLLITRESLLVSLYRKVLKPEMRVRVSGLIELSKALVKTSPNLGIVVLDFGLQDKNGTNSKIIKRILDKAPDVFLLVLTSHPIQTRTVKQILGSRIGDSRFCIAKGVSKYVRGSWFLIRAKRKLLASQTNMPNRGTDAQKK